MATITLLKRVSSAITGMTSKVSDTFVESVGDIAAACHDAFGGSLDIEKADITAIQNAVADGSAWGGTPSEGARKSEVKAIVMAYKGLPVACKHFKRMYGELRREHVIKLAREIPIYETSEGAAQVACDYYETRAAGTGTTKGLTPAKKLAAGLTLAIENCGKNAALKQSLYALARKHNVKVTG